MRNATVNYNGAGLARGMYLGGANNCMIVDDQNILVLHPLSAKGPPHSNLGRLRTLD